MNINKIIKDNNNEIQLIYKYDKEITKIKIFGGKFVENNKDICKIEYKNKEYELEECFNIENLNLNKDIFEIKLKGINNITNMSYMFYQCKSLLHIKYI